MRWGRTQRGEREHKVPLVGVGAVSGAYVRETETQRAGRVRLWQYMRQIYNKNPHIPPAPYFRRTPPSVGLRFHKKKKKKNPIFPFSRVSGPGGVSQFTTLYLPIIFMLITVKSF